MNIAFFTEGGYNGKVPRNNPNMRTDQAWICTLDATHHCVFNLNELKSKYDIGIVIIPKDKNREHLSKQNYPLIEKLREYCSKVLVMQESTHWDWQDESFNSMVWYYTQLTEADGILCHNDIDVPYFKGITNKPAFVFPTLMIEDNIIPSTTKENKVFVAGNWHTTYRGFDAWVIGQEFELPMIGFKSGKFKEGEEQNGINYLPWMDWSNFMSELSKCKYGVQCYQASAGQFPLNCAYLGIPCIGYDDINTQKDLFPDLSVKRGDIQHARRLANNLVQNDDFYNRVSTKAKELYNELYKEDKFLEKWEKIKLHL
jgi:hypothetical protein